MLKAVSIFVGGDRYCKITSQNNCKKCRFYRPSETAWRINMANTIKDMDEIIEKKKEEIAKLGDEVKEKKALIESQEPYVNAYKKIIDAKTR